VEDGVALVQNDADGRNFLSAKEKSQAGRKGVRIARKKMVISEKI